MRYINQFYTTLSDSEANEIVSSYFTRGEYTFDLFEGEYVWHKGKGFWTAPKVAKFEYHDHMITLQAWLKFVWLPGVYGHDMGFDGFYGWAIKQAYQSEIAVLESQLGYNPGYAQQGYIPQQNVNAPIQNAPQGANNFCPKCGGALPQNAVFCGKCGEKITK